MADHIRMVKTSSGATAIQIVRYEKNKTIIISHIGSAHTEDEVTVLKETAANQIAKATIQKSLFPAEKQTISPILVINKSEYLGVRYSFIYDVLTQIFRLFDFHTLRNQLLLDLVLIRIIQPVSKLESLEYLSHLFGITYGKSSLYQALTLFPALKIPVEKHIVTFAKEQYRFDFSIVFYDVTTLYYETFTEDEDTVDATGTVIEQGLRKDGFGKERKPGQPLIVIGLIVTKEGFPVSYEVFEGNTFEGKTFIPAITKFKDTYNVEHLTVVADAAMISFDNVEQLKEHQLSYIVGGRMANLKREEMQQVYEELIGQSQTGEELQKIDGKSMRIQTARGLLICDFSLKRYQKDRREMEKQIAKAKILLEQNQGSKRTKFLMNKDKKKTAQILNTELIEKTKLLLGIKGYYTNLVDTEAKMTNQDIIDQYHNLWQVEKAFRIAKSDLVMRPIYHFKRQAIEAHVLICFMALAVCKYMELKSGKSTKKIVKLLKSITEARIKNLLTNEEIIMRMKLPEDVRKLWKTLLPTDLPH